MLQTLLCCYIADQHILPSTCRDVDARPTAIEALAHPWLATEHGNRCEGTPLTGNIVQRIQVCNSCRARPIF